MRKRIGEFLVDAGVLERSRIPEILKYAEESGLRFGEAAMELGLLTPETMIKVFGPDFAVDFFHLDPSYFPEATRGLLTGDQAIRYGMLPLGIKNERRWFRSRTILNLGLLDPSRADAREAAMAAASSRVGKPVDGVKPFLILADQYLRVLADIYGITESSIRERDPAFVEPRLQLFLNKS